MKINKRSYLPHNVKADLDYYTVMDVLIWYAVEGIPMSHTVSRRTKHCIWIASQSSQQSSLIVSPCFPMNNFIFSWFPFPNCFLIVPDLLQFYRHDVNLSIQILMQVRESLFFKIEMICNSKYLLILLIELILSNLIYLFIISNTWSICISNSLYLLHLRVRIGRIVLA